MSIKGFTVDGQDYQYNYPNLDNIPEITPESIGAASQEDFDGLSEEVDALKSESYNLIDPTGITPYQSTSAADLTRTGFVIRNTAEATYSRGYLYLTLKPNTDYTFSAKKHTTSGVAYVGYSEAPAEGEPFPSANISLISRTAPDDETITKTFTTTTGILVIRFYATWDTAELGKVEYSEIMVIDGTKAKPFVRHVFAQDDEARNAVNDPQTGLDQKAGILRNTASGAIVSFTPDASVKDLLGLTVAVEPVQDLHGYDNPWPAGGGKNKIQFVAENDRGGTYAPSSIRTYNDGILTISGTVDAPNIWFYSQDITSILATLGTATISLDIISGDLTNLDFRVNISEGGQVIDRQPFSTNDTTLVYESSKTYIVYGLLSTQAVIGGSVNLTSGIQLESGSTKTAWTPYSNICPISGWTGAKVTRTGDNIAPTVGWRVGGITGSGQTTSAVHYAMYSPFIPCEPNTTYYFTVTGNGFKKRLCGYETDQSNPMASTQGTVTEEKTATITTGVNDRFLRLAVESIDQTVELSFADFTPVVAGVGDTYSITFPTEAGTVYGGILDVTTGKLTVDRAMVDMGTLTWKGPQTTPYGATNHSVVFSSAKNPVDSNTRANIICSMFKTGISNTAYLGITKECVCLDAGGNLAIYSNEYDSYTAAQFKVAMSGVQLCYELATPIEVDLTPQQIETIKGQINNVWADVGDVTVEFAEDIKTYIDNKFAELQALALENN